MGLVPLGPDPQSGLWEFSHLATGEPAQRGPDGELLLGEETGVVLVLLPGGTFWMGAQQEDPAGRNYDPMARWNESPVHEVSLSPFFLAKFELTQGQWQRLTGANPSLYEKGYSQAAVQRYGTGDVRTHEKRPTLLRPVEFVSLVDCLTWLPRAGLQVPTEAQWEFGARGGTHTPWWTGVDQQSLSTECAANLADPTLQSAGASMEKVLDREDGYAFPAPVGAFAANPFGLHDVTGNVWEWCRDGFDSDFYARSGLEDPLCEWGDPALCIYRGGSFRSGAAGPRSAFRTFIAPSAADDVLGVRCARAIEP